MRQYSSRFDWFWILIGSIDFHEVKNTKFDYFAYNYFYLCEPAVFQIGNWEMKRGQGADLVSIPTYLYI